LEAEQKQCKNENILNSLTAEIHKNKRHAAGNSEKVVPPCVNTVSSTLSNTHDAVHSSVLHAPPKLAGWIRLPVESYQRLENGFCSLKLRARRCSVGATARQRFTRLAKVS